MSLCLSLYLTPIIRKGALKFNILDNPDGRLKTQKQPIPYLGGIAVYLTYIIGIGIVFDYNHEVLGLLLASSIVVMLGLVDDLKVLTPGVKLFGQTLAALVLIRADIYIKLTFLPQWAVIILTYGWLMLMMNAFNLIDVMDGCAAGIAAIAGLAFFTVAMSNNNIMIATLTIALVGSILGFWYYNLNPAHIYLGDAGSMFLGLNLGALAMIGQYTTNHLYAALAPIIILALPIFEVIFLIIIRTMHHQPIMQGSPDHVAIRLQKHGFSVMQSMIILYAAAFILAGMGLLLIHSTQKYVWYIILGTLLILILLGFLIGNEKFLKNRSKKLSPLEENSKQPQSNHFSA